MPSQRELLEALTLAMLNRAEQGGDDVEEDLETLAAMADDPEELAAAIDEEVTENKTLDMDRHEDEVTALIHGQRWDELEQSLVGWGVPDHEAEQMVRSLKTRTMQ